MIILQVCRAAWVKTEIFLPSLEVYSYQPPFFFFFFQTGKWTLSVSKRSEIQQSAASPRSAPARVVCLLDARTSELHNPNVQKLRVLAVPIMAHSSYRCLAPPSKTILWVFSTHKPARFTIRDSQCRRSLSLGFISSCNITTETFFLTT